MKPDTPEMVVCGQQLDTKWQDRAVERATIKQRYAEQMKADLAKADREVSRAMHKALAAGFSKSRIGRMIGTADWRTINNFLALTAEEFEIKRVAADTVAVERFTTVVAHARHEMMVTMLVRGDGTEMRRTPRRVVFTFRPQTSLADFSNYTADASEFDLDSEAMLTEIRDTLQEALPPGRGIKVYITGVPTLGPQSLAPSWMANPPLEDESWLEEE